MYQIPTEEEIAEQIAALRAGPDVCSEMDQAEYAEYSAQVASEKGRDAAPPKSVFYICPDCGGAEADDPVTVCYCDSCGSTAQPARITLLSGCIVAAKGRRIYA